MTILYTSTQTNQKPISASQAILQGIATDGGLFVPTEFPTFAFDFEEWQTLSYQEMAFRIMTPFFNDFTAKELRDCIAKAYDEKFETPEIAPVVKSGDHYFLELFHGPTLAFKDMALSLLPHLMTIASKKNHSNREIVILTATSGDTGKAAMAAFADVPNTKIIVFYPKDGVSAIQEKQMLTQVGENTFVVAVAGNFDDAQTKVKELLNDHVLINDMAKHGQQFSSANSINIGRLIPQVVYYVYAYIQLVKKGELKAGESLDICVPTGNFGNILAGYFAKKIGLPLDFLLCASNQNNVLTDFFQTGAYDKKRPFYVTSSPSMDILVSSNLERLLYLLTDRDPVEVKQWMTELKLKGSFSLDKKKSERWSDFKAGYASEADTQNTIANEFKENGYVIDPHTAVADFVAKQNEIPQHKTLVVSTASPYKFPKTVVESISGQSIEVDDFAAIQKLNQLTGLSIPAAITALKEATEKNPPVILPADMKAYVQKILDI